MRRRGWSNCRCRASYALPQEDPRGRRGAARGPVVRPTRSSHSWRSPANPRLKRTRHGQMRRRAVLRDGTTAARRPPARPAARPARGRARCGRARWSPRQRGPDGRQLGDPAEGVIGPAQPGDDAGELVLPAEHRVAELLPRSSTRSARRPRTDLDRTAELALHSHFATARPWPGRRSSEITSTSATLSARMPSPPPSAPSPRGRPPPAGARRCAPPPRPSGRRSPAPRSVPELAPPRLQQQADRRGVRIVVLVNLRRRMLQPGAAERRVVERIGRVLSPHAARIDVRVRVSYRSPGDRPKDPPRSPLPTSTAASKCSGPQAHVRRRLEIDADLVAGTPSARRK